MKKRNGTKSTALVLTLGTRPALARRREASPEPADVRVETRRCTPGSLAEALSTPARGSSGPERSANQMRWP